MVKLMMNLEQLLTHLSLEMITNLSRARFYLDPLSVIEINRKLPYIITLDV